MTALGKQMAKRYVQDEDHGALAVLVLADTLYIAVFMFCYCTQLFAREGVILLRTTTLSPAHAPFCLCRLQMVQSPIKTARLQMTTGVMDGAKTYWLRCRTSKPLSRTGVQRLSSRPDGKVTFMAWDPRQHATTCMGCFKATWRALMRRSCFSKFLMCVSLH